MEARVKADGRLNVVTAFGGREFTKGEWRPVPDGFEAAAEAHPLLQVTSEAVLPVVSEEPETGGLTDESSGTSEQRSGGRRRGRRDGE
jgi:hypothetical protein